MSASSVNRESSTVEHRRTIPHGSAAIWRALTTPAAIEIWWGHPAHFPQGMVTGAEGTFEWVGNGLMPIKIIQADDLTDLQFWWGDPGDDAPGPTASRIEFSLRPAEDSATELTVREILASGARDGTDAPEPTEETLAEQSKGWTKVVDSLESCLQD